MAATNISWTDEIKKYYASGLHSLAQKAALSAIVNKYQADLEKANENAITLKAITEGNMYVDNTINGRTVAISNTSYNAGDGVDSTHIVIPFYAFAQNALAFHGHNDMNNWVNYDDPFGYTVQVDAIHQSAGYYVSLWWAATRFYKDYNLGIKNVVIAYFTAVGSKGINPAACQTAIDNYVAQGKIVVAKYNDYLKKFQVAEDYIDPVKGALWINYTNELSKILFSKSLPSSTLNGMIGGAASGGGSTTKTKPGPKPVAPPTPDVPTPSYPPTAEFNLPPHNASLPVRPQKLAGAAMADYTVDDTKRRGRFWFYADSGQQFAKTLTDATTANGKTQAANGSNYGFQFLWNPSEYTTSVTVNPDVTPSSGMYWSTALPVFPSGENMSVSIILDRVNDFASFGPQAHLLGSTLAALGGSANASSALTNALSNSFSYLLSLEAALTQLTAQQANDAVNPNLYVILDDLLANYANAGSNPYDKLTDLMRRGTLADLEYLYKTINGPDWVRLDQNTSDIGFLAMTLVEIELGPTRYLGYLNNLNITHSMFTEEMIPIRTQVDLSFVLMASAAIAQSTKVPGATS